MVEKNEAEMIAAGYFNEYRKKTKALSGYASYNNIRYLMDSVNDDLDDLVKIVKNLNKWYGVINE